MADEKGQEMKDLRIVRESGSSPAWGWGFRYSVQIWESLEDGRAVYCGNGKFQKTAGDVLRYGAKQADIFSSKMIKDIFACMDGDDLDYTVGVYKWHVFRCYPSGKITAASFQEKELAKRFLNEEAAG